MSVQLLVSGISLGAVYALIAVGFAIVFSILKFSNFAHGGMISACAFMGFFFQRMFSSPPPFLITVLFSALCGVVLSLLIDTAAYRRIRAKQAPNIYYFLASITVAILIEQVLTVFFGKNLYGYPNIFKSTTFTIGGIRFSSMDTLILIISLVILSVLIYVINRTRIGLAIRAVAINPATSRLMGINSDRTILLVFVIAGALAGVSGVLLGAKYSVYPTLGSSMMMKGFLASVIGGLGSLGGAIAAAIALGMIEIILTYFFGALSIPVFLFGIMLVFLAVRPEGISGKFAKDKV
ncbi:MAG: branched-chain amino acid ABC transporter permease [Lachnospiraceae bacterium]|nr:branched-chain amino acid ABC transporter permease [Lachnospiraceae bacterium]